MKKGLMIGALSIMALTSPAQAIDLFNKAAKEIDANFLRPLSDIKNTLENTVKIFQGIENPTDKLRVSGGFLKELARAMDKMNSFIEFVNNKFINSVLSKASHAKVQQVVIETQNVLALLQQMADGMRTYGLKEQMNPQLRSSSQELPEDFPVVSQLDTE